ncbi:hypothetical protein F4808DRAFT_467203 [Astrocystis sublimbata]|nr:hypothetical protein F4808DRAFT_467203 [Astrocystis sublimbata]
MAQNIDQEHSKDAEYLLPEPQKEVDRLTANDSVFAYGMKNKRVLAPLDMTKPGLKVLDSATADVRSRQSALRPPGGGKTATPRQSVGFLSKLVAPGGWIQLGEMDVKKPAKGGQAITDAMVLMRTMFRAVCGSDSFAYDMTDWLREEGFEDVTEEVFEIPLGPLCDDPVIGKRGADTGIQSWQAVLGAVQKLKLDVDESVTDNIIERLTDELNRNGGAYNLRFVYGRAPSRK